jgi:IclR family acetate operon transcriptional repressor
VTDTVADRSSAQGADGVQSLERALDILEHLSRSKTELGVSEIGPAVKLANATAHRLLATLVRRGYARQNPETRKYALGIKALALAINVRDQLGPMAQPFLRELTEISQESSNLAALDRNSVVCVEQVPAPRLVRMFTEPGNRVPLHSTGTGKVLLAYQPEDTIDAMIQQGGLPRFTAHTITDEQELKEELSRVREQGYAVDSEEMEEGVRCLAAPVFGPDGRVLAAMSISGPVGRLGQDRLKELIPHIKRLADGYSLILNGSG